MSITIEELREIADMTVRLCEIELDGQMAHSTDKAPALFAGLLRAYAAIAPEYTRCRGCQNYRRNHGESDNGAVMEYCNKDGLPIFRDGVCCAEYQPKTR